METPFKSSKVLNLPNGGHIMSKLSFGLILLLPVLGAAQPQNSFMGYTWGTPEDQFDRTLIEVDKLDSVNFWEVENYVTRSLNVDSIGGIPIQSGFVSFYQDRFFSVVLQIHRMNLPLFRRVTEKKFGKPRQLREKRWGYGEEECLFDVWEDEHTYIDLAAGGPCASTYAAFRMWSKDISEEVGAAIAAKKLEKELADSLLVDSAVNEF